MRTALALAATLTLVLAGCSADAEETTAHDHSDGAMHEQFVVPAEGAPEIVDVVVTADAASGYNVHIETKNFTWTPQNVNGEPVAGEGHAHLYIDGVKIARLYAPDFHVPGGTATDTSHFFVTLNANDHSEYWVDGVVVGLDVHPLGAEEHTHADD